jgi:hypothetical protein
MAVKFDDVLSKKSEEFNFKYFAGTCGDNHGYLLIFNGTAPTDELSDAQRYYGTAKLSGTTSWKDKTFTLHLKGPEASRSWDPKIEKTIKDHFHRNVDGAGHGDFLLSVILYISFCRSPSLLESFPKFAVTGPRPPRTSNRGVQAVSCRTLPQATLE